MWWRYNGATVHFVHEKYNTGPRELYLCELMIQLWTWLIGYRTRNTINTRLQFPPCVRAVYFGVRMVCQSFASHGMRQSIYDHIAQSSGEDSLTCGVHYGHVHWYVNNFGSVSTSKGVSIFIENSSLLSSFLSRRSSSMTGHCSFDVFYSCRKEVKWVGFFQLQILIFC